MNPPAQCVVPIARCGNARARIFDTYNAVPRIVDINKFAVVGDARGCAIDVGRLDLVDVVYVVMEHAGDGVARTPGQVGIDIVEEHDARSLVVGTGPARPVAQNVELPLLGQRRDGCGDKAVVGGVEFAVLSQREPVESIVFVEEAAIIIVADLRRVREEPITRNVVAILIMNERVGAVLIMQMQRPAELIASARVFRALCSQSDLFHSN